MHAWHEHAQARHVLLLDCACKRKSWKLQTFLTDTSPLKLWMQWVLTRMLAKSKLYRQASVMRWINAHIYKSTPHLHATCHPASWLKIPCSICEACVAIIDITESCIECEVTAQSRREGISRASYLEGQKLARYQEGRALIPVFSMHDVKECVGLQRPEHFLMETKILSA
jgi:hypothetical protein